MNDLEDIKNKWQALSHAAPPDSDDFWKVSRPARHLNHLQKIKCIFRIMSVVCALCAFLTPENLISLGFPVWLCWCACIFFIAALGGMLILLHTASDIDIISGSSVEVLSGITKLVRRRLIFKYCLFPGAILIVGGILYYVSYDMYLLMGAIAGGLIGFLIGLSIDRNVKRQLQAISRDLETA